MIHISLESGLGGFDYAAEQIGWTNGVSCEINSFCRTILSYYWPDAYHHDDVFTLTGEKINYELSKRYGTHWRTNGLVLTCGFP